MKQNTTLTRQRLSMEKLTSSNRDPTLAVTSSIPVPCAAVSFPAIILSLAGGSGTCTADFKVRSGNKTIKKQEAGECITKLVIRLGICHRSRG